MADPLPCCAIVIPTYNGGYLTAACLGALLGDPPQSSEAAVIVVDDGSTDASNRALERFGDAVQVLERSSNVGFAGACNAGAEAAGDVDYLVFLNNDTIPQPGWLDALIAEAEGDREVVAVGAKLLFPNGLVQHAGVAIGQDRWPHHIYAGFPGEHPAVNHARDVRAVSAACLLIRRSEFKALGGFDTAYRNGYEDIDLCLRLAQRGGRIRYTPRSVLYHLESVTRWPDGVATAVEEPSAVFRQRWGTSVSPDDVQHYLDDGLITIRYADYHPLVLGAAPELAVLERDDAQLAEVDQILARRSAQVMELLGAETRRALRETADIEKMTALAQSPSVRKEISGREHRLGEATGSDAERLISVLMPIRNAAPFLAGLLPAVLRQQVSTRLELIAVDSGSQDGSVEILRQFGATVLSIAPTDFDHGLVRNLAAERARGEVLVYLTHRSLPMGVRWLASLLADLDADQEVVGVCSRVVARSDADILTRRDAERELSGSPDRQRKQITNWDAYRAMPEPERRAFLNFHTVSAAIRRDAWARTPFRSVHTIGEDLLWAREVLEDGWALVHEPASVVEHSHSYTPSELFSRNVDDGIANRDITGRALEADQIMPQIRAMVADDWSYLREALGPGSPELEHWQFESMVRRVTQTVGQWVGVNYQSLADGTAAQFSAIPRVREAALRANHV